MKSETATEVDPTQSTPAEFDGEAAPKPPRRRLEPNVKDDGMVPEKQISRWTNEGGTWHPLDG